MGYVDDAFAKLKPPGDRPDRKQDLASAGTPDP